MYREVIRDWLTCNAGRPRGQCRSITDALDTPSLR
jgi:hypothetical protein